VPVFVRCTACGGAGHEWPLPCAGCARQGVVEAERSVHVRIAPATRPGTVVEVPLQRLGIHNLFLRLHVSVAA
jgi:DnaJ-class molecular chaperone